MTSSTLMVIGTDCTNKCKSNYHMVMTTTALYDFLNIVMFSVVVEEEEEEEEQDNYKKKMKTLQTMCSARCT